MKYTNIEIGTSDFRTLISSANGNGISIEPVPCYFNNLPEQKDWIKLNCAVSDYDGKALMYYVNPDKITTEPMWVRGCNSINEPHPTIEQMYPHLIETVSIDVISVRTLIKKYDITEVGYLKIDTEGHDLVIMNALLDTDLRPRKILFESNVLSNEDEYHQLVDRLKQYRVNRVNFDTICELI